MVSKLIVDIVNTAEDIFYPARCPVCDNVHRIGEKGLCNKCKNLPVLIKEPVCMKCGREITDNSEYCEECERKDFYFERGRALCLYDANMKHSISNFKYHKRKEYAITYAKMIYDNLKGFINAVSPDAFVPVPVHQKRYYERGYNQAEILSQKISELTGIDTLNMLKRVKNTERQKELDIKRRKDNLRNAFTINDEENYLGKIKDINKVILIDDIYTTGSTLNECAYVLKTEASVKKVYFITLCQGKN